MRKIIQGALIKAYGRHQDNKEGMWVEDSAGEIRKRSEGFKGGAGARVKKKKDKLLPLQRKPGCCPSLAARECEVSEERSKADLEVSIAVHGKERDVRERRGEPEKAAKAAWAGGTRE
ncbi:unnamed protein product [Malus fusca]